MVVASFSGELMTKLPKRQYQRVVIAITLLFSVLIVALVLTVAAHADEPGRGGGLGLGRFHGYNAGASQSGCGSSWAICRYRGNLRRNGEYTYRRAHNGNWSPAYQAKQRQLAAKCTPATVWWDACH